MRKLQDEIDELRQEVVELRIVVLRIVDDDLPILARHPLSRQEPVVAAHTSRVLEEELKETTADGSGGEEATITPADVRQWARAQNIAVSRRGRVSADVLARYKAARVGVDAA